MNILFVESSVEPSRGGIQRVSYRLRQYFEDNDHQCFFLYYLEGCKSIRSEKLYKFDEKEPYILFKDRLLNIITPQSIDVVIIQGIVTHNVLSFIKDNKKNQWTKIIFCLHNTPDYYLKNNEKRSIRRRLKEYIFGNGNANLHRIIYNSVNAYVLLSKSFEDLFVKLYKTDREHLYALPNPLSFDNINISRPKKKQVLIVTRFHEDQKNLHGAYRIWKKIENYVVSEGWNLVLAGYGMDQESSLAYVNKLQLKNFSFIGKATDPINLYLESSIFMMTSFYEGFPMTLVEAQQCGCVPMAFDSFSAVHDVIGNNCGLLIQPFNEDLYAEKLCQLMQNETLRNELSSNAIKECKKFALANVGEAWLKLFEKIQ